MGGNRESQRTSCDDHVGGGRLGTVRLGRPGPDQHRVHPVVGAGDAGRRAARHHGRLREDEPRHQGHAGQRPLFNHARPDRHRRRLGHAERRRRPRRRLGERPGQAGRDRFDGPADGRRELRPEPDRRHHQGRRPERDVSAGLVRLPGLRQPRPRQGCRRRQDADQPHRVRRGREEDDQRRQERVRLGAAAVARNPQRYPERRDGLGLGLGRLDAEGRQAGSRERGRRRHAGLCQAAQRRRRHLAGHLRQEGAGQGRGVCQRPRRDDDRLRSPTST